MSYAEQLKNPKWQRKRLEILERDKWTCQQCQDTESTLTVHHKSYRLSKGAFVDVWDYQDKELITLCDRCHAEEEESLKYLRSVAYFRIRDICENAETIYCALNAVITESNSRKGRFTPHDVLMVMAVYNSFTDKLQDNNSRWFSLFVDKVNERYDELKSRHDKVMVQEDD